MLVRTALALVAFAIVTAPLAAQEKKEDAKSDLLKLNTERVIVFKDGYCLFIKKGVGTSNDKGEVYTETVPDAAVLGSFWATPKEGRLVSMNAGTVTTVDKSAKTVVCTEHIELLKANQGKTCVVELNDNQTRQGTIREVLVRETKAPAPAEPGSELSAELLASGVVTRIPSVANADANHNGTTISGVTGSLFVLATDEGDVVIQVAQIRRLTIKGLKITDERTVTKTKTAKRLTFRCEKPNAAQELSIMYFVPGIRWIPTYRATLPADDAKESISQISLQAELLNEAEDLVDVPVDLVVGVPNFRFKTTVSPFSLEATLRNVLLEAAPQLMGRMDNQAFSNAMFSQRASEVRHHVAAADAGQGGGLELPPELAAAGSQDLFIYKLPKLTLKKHHRAAVPIFAATAPTHDLHTWDLHLKRRDIETAPSGSLAVSPLTLSNNEVWHQIELSNKTQVPWTTGAILMLLNQQPQAQELLTYTSPGGSVQVPVTVSVDVRGSYIEEETGRQMKALQWSGYDYARIEKKGTLTITNSKKVAVETSIKCQLGGKATEAADGQIQLAPFHSGDWTEYVGHPAVNNHSTVTWRLKLKPGETVKLPVKYHYYTRH